MARKTKLDTKLQKAICDLLKKGATDKTACESVGIATSTFYDWIVRGQAEDSEYSEFSEAVTQARAKAHAIATSAFQSGLLPSVIKEKVVEEFTETRLDKEGKPYDYKHKTTRTTERKMPPDWRAGEAWLKRRDRENWSEKNILAIEDWRTEAAALLKDGIITPEQLVQEIGPDLAREVFKSIGLPGTIAGEGQKPSE